MINSIKKIGILLPLSLFVVIFQPPFGSFRLMHLIGLASLVYLLLLQIKIFSYEKCLTVLFFACFIYLLIIEFILNDSSIGSLVGPIFFLVDIIPFSLACRDYLKRRNCDIHDIINLFVFTSLIQVVLVMLSFFIPAIHISFVNMMINYGYSMRLLTLLEYRLFGFASGLTFATPVFLSFFSVVLIVYVMKEKRNVTLYILCALGCFFSALINARTSMIVLGVGCSVFILTRNLSFFKKILFLFLCVGLYFLFDNVLLSFLLEYSPESYKWIDSGMDEMSSFLIEGEKETGYFAYVTNEEKYELPDFIGFLFGKGYRVMQGWNEFGVHSDIGYINDIWFGGLFYIIILYSIFYKCMYSLYRNRNKVVSFIGLFLMILYPILNFKGYVFSMNDLTNAMFFLSIVVYEDGTPLTYMNKK